MKVFISGGAGYIGSAVAHELVRAGDSVVVFDNLYQGHLEAVPETAVFVKGDLADAALVEATIAEHKPDGIMHFASHTLVGESMEHPFLYLEDNIVNGMNLIKSAVNHQVGRFILSSTANLFDEPEHMPIRPDERIVPGSPYGESKHILERYLYWMDRLYGMRYAALRYFNACGAMSCDVGERHDPETHLIPLVLQVALGQREKIYIYGDDYDTPDGTCIRDYIHILDLASAHIMALRDLDKGSRTYNLGNGRGFSVLELIEAAREVTGHAIPAEVGPRRPGDPDILVADSQKIKDDLGWQPQYDTLQKIIGSAWEWHSQHPNGFSGQLLS